MRIVHRGISLVQQRKGALITDPTGDGDNFWPPAKESLTLILVFIMIKS
jgi:hypothetical protein